MKTMAQSFLTDEEQQRVTASVQRAEKTTSGEIVPMIVSTSHSYPLAPIIGGLFFALPIGLLVARLLGTLWWIGPDNVWLFLACFAPLFILAHWLVNRILPLKRLFLLPSRANAEVQEAATTAFFTEGLYRTREENGILLYISVFEQRVWILGDRGINEKIDPQRWQEIVTLVTEGIRSNRRCPSICEAIELIGAILQQHFPYRKDDQDELHNLIIR